MEESAATGSGDRPVPRPFQVNPEVMASIRPMQASDIPDVARLHEAAMGNSLWAKLGSRFLVEVYRGLVDSDRFLAFVYLEDNRVRGFIAGSLDTPSMLREVFRHQWPMLALAALPNGLKPSVLRHLVHTNRYSDASGSEIQAESLFCS
ncbi:MAG: hypothetical protein QGG40_21045, partial [Myxococcota bacterium]|nr:hypothetical protein [Myxococcota bacterium]